LNSEPLIDAVFELRFTSSALASSVLPGFLFSKLKGKKTINRLQTSEIPKPVRDTNPNLEFAPLMQLDWDKFLISISDRSLGVGCKLPYPGWAVFKPAILQIVELVGEIDIVENVQRFSMKYIDLIPSNDLREQVSMITASVAIGNHTLEKESFFLRIEIPSNGALHIVSVASGAKAKLADGSVREGLMVDIDSVRDEKGAYFAQWLERAPAELEEVHSANKEMFFECLHSKTIDFLEPVYE
jgi:uncharacterized protein (TIGR04255 family)